MKKFIPYIVALSTFFIVSYAFTPEVLENKVVNQSDISSWQGMAKEMNDYNKATGDAALWSDSQFGGMPTFAYGMVLKGDVTKYIYDALTRALSRPPVYLLVALLGAFFLFWALGVNPYLAIVGAIAVAFCSYNMQIIQVGHNTKMVAIAFAPWVLAGVVYAFRRNWLWGSIFTAFALSFQIKANHIQISYYLALIILAFAISELIYAVREGRFRAYLKSGCALLAAAILGIALNANNLLPLRDYTQYTMRGGSELAKEAAGGAGSGSAAKGGAGLDIEYATAWSYGIEETPNLLIPNFNGGSSSGALTRDSETYKALRKGGYQSPDSIIRALPLYFGPQPFTAGPMYLGAISLFLAVLGLVCLDGRNKWWAFAVGIFMVLLAWGSHIMPFTKFVFNALPYYNKFRTVSMSLTGLQILVPVLGVLAVQKLFVESASAEGSLSRISLKKGGLIALAVTAGFCLLCALVPSLFGPFDSAADGSLPKDIAAALVRDRQGLLRADAIRSLIFILLSAAVLVLWQKRVLKQYLAIGILGVLVLVDFWGVDKRYLNSTHFVTKKQFNSAYNIREVDKAIFEFGQDLDHYRVLDLSENTFNSSLTSYFHKSIGGYSPAKLSRYQDLIEKQLGAELGAVSREINGAISAGATTLGEVSDALKYHPALAMLDCRYIIVDPSMPPVEYPYAQGSGFCIPLSQVHTVTSAHEEMALLGSIDTRTEAVLGDGVKLSAPSSALGSSVAGASSSLASSPTLASGVAGSVAGSGSSQGVSNGLSSEVSSGVAGSGSGSVSGSVAGSVAAGSGSVSVSVSGSSNGVSSGLVSGGFVGGNGEGSIGKIVMDLYSPNYLEYTVTVPEPCLAVFSEIYYPGGWKAYIGEEEHPILRANYLLRALELPAGTHQVTFIFAPESYTQGQKISLAASILLLLLLLLAAAIAQTYRTSRHKINIK